MRGFHFAVEEGSKQKLAGLSVGYIYFRGVRTEKSNPAVDMAIASASRAVAERFSDTKSIAEDPVIKGIRAVFSKAGLDPTKERASGEALIRRIAGGQGLYRINAVVDANNAVSLLTGCPCGVYDLEKVEGDTVTLLVGGSGQAYEGIGGKQLNAENRILTADAKGIFGGPTADSGRTCITLGTKEVLMLIYHPPGAPKEMLAGAMKEAERLMKEAAGASVLRSGVFSV